MSRPVMAWLAVLLLVMGATGIWIGTKYARALSGQSGHQAEVDPEYLQAPIVGNDKLLTEFTLTERSGKKFSSRELAGKVYVTSFFFSSCPANCLRQNQKLREIEAEYGPKGVKFLSITCDPVVDTPERLREYADKLEAGKDDWLFLTGDLTYTRRVAGEMFLVPLDKNSHTEFFLVSDKWGNRRGHFAWDKLDEVTALKLDLDKLLAEQEPPAKPSPASAESDNPKPESSTVE